MPPNWRSDSSIFTSGHAHVHNQRATEQLELALLLAHLLQTRTGLLVESRTVVEHLVRERRNSQEQLDLCLEPRTWSADRLAIGKLSHRIMVLDLIGTADLQPRERIDERDLGRVHSSDRRLVVGDIHRHTVALDQRSQPSDSELHTHLHSCIELLVDSCSKLDGFILRRRKIDDEEHLDHQQRRCALERLRDRVSGFWLLVLGGRPPDLESQRDRTCGSGDLDLLHSASRLVGIDSVHRHAGALDQRSDARQCRVLAVVSGGIDVHLESSGIVDSLGHWSDIDIDTLDLGLEQRLGVSLSQSTRHAVVGVMVLDLVGTADLELGASIRSSIDLDRVHAADRIVVERSVRRHSRALDQRSSSTDSDVHAVVHGGAASVIESWCRIGSVGLERRSVVDDLDLDLERRSRIAGSLSIGIALVGIMVLDLVGTADLELEQRIAGIDDLDLDLERRSSIAGGLSIGSVLVRIMVLDLVGTADLELEQRIAGIDDLDRVHAADRIGIDTSVRRHSRALDQRSDQADDDVLAVVLVGINILIESSIAQYHIRERGSVVDDLDLDLERRSRTAGSLSIWNVLVRIMVLDLVGTADLELEQRIAGIDDLDHVHAADRIGIDTSVRRQPRALDQRSDQADDDVLAVMLGSACVQLSACFYS